MFDGVQLLLECILLFLMTPSRFSLRDRAASIPKECCVGMFDPGKLLLHEEACSVRQQASHASAEIFSIIQRGLRPSGYDQVQHLFRLPRCGYHATHSMQEKVETE